MDLKKMKKAQVTLFILLGIILISVFVLLVMTFDSKINLFGSIKSPSDFLTSCIEQSLQDSEEEFFDSDNYLQEISLKYKYAGKEMPFLCYSTEFYSPCIPQSPLMTEAIRQKMENKLSRDFSQCILTVKEDYERKGYNIIYDSFEVDLLFEESQISYKINSPITLTKEESLRVSLLEGSLSTILPAILRTTETIINYESTLCEFNHITWQAINRNVLIKRDRGGDQTKVYTLTGRDSGKEVSFAIRTCVLPAGI